MMMGMMPGVDMSGAAGMPQATPGPPLVQPDGFGAVPGEILPEEDLIRGDVVAYFPKTHRNLKYNKLADKNWLKEQYVVLDKTSSEISNQFSIPMKRIESFIKKYGLERKRHSVFCGLRDISKHRDGLGCIVKDYNSGISAKDISLKYGCSPASVSYNLKKLGVETRSQSEIAREHCLKLNKTMVGDKHPRWEGGKSFEPYGIEFSKKLKKEIKEKNGNVCKICGEPDTVGSRLDIHHVDYNKKNNKHDNLVPLCHRCHAPTSVNRNWQFYFYKEWDYTWTN